MNADSVTIIFLSTVMAAVVATATGAVYFVRHVKAERKAKMYENEG